MSGAALVAEQCLDPMLDDTHMDIVYQNNSLFDDSLEEEFTVSKADKTNGPAPIDEKPRWLGQPKGSPMVVMVTREQSPLLRTEPREEAESPPLFPLTQPDVIKKEPKYAPVFGQKKQFVIPKIKNSNNSPTPTGVNISNSEALPSVKKTNRSLACRKNSSDMEVAAGFCKFNPPNVCKDDSPAKKRRVSCKAKSKAHRAEKGRRNLEKMMKLTLREQQSLRTGEKKIGKLPKQADNEQLQVEGRRQEAQKKRKTSTENINIVKQDSGCEKKRNVQASHCTHISAPRERTPTQVIPGAKNKKEPSLPLVLSFIHSPTSSEEEEEGMVTPPNVIRPEDPNRSVSRPKPSLLLHATETEPSPKLLQCHTLTDSGSSDRETVPTSLSLHGRTRVISLPLDDGDTSGTTSPDCGETPSPLAKKIMQNTDKRPKCPQEDGQILQQSLKKKRTQKEILAERTVVHPSSRTLWVQCDRVDCLKWRRLHGCHDPAEVPGKWYCYMNPDPEHNSCQAPAESSDEIDEEEEEYIYSPFIPGSLVWAKLEGFPWWPAMVDVDPDDDVYYETNGGSTPVEFHVVFLDTPVCRAWIGHRNVQSFTDQCCSYSDLSPEKIPIKYQKSLDASVQEAKHALCLSLEERLQKYGFLQRYNKERVRKRKSTSRQVDIADSSLERGGSWQSSTVGERMTCASTPTVPAMKRNRP